MKYKFRIGPSTIITLVLAIIAGYMFYRNYLSNTRNGGSHNPPIIERQVISDAPRTIAPVPEYLLRHQQELNLTPAQVQRITALAQSFRKDIAPVQKQIEAAMKKFQENTEPHQNDGRLSTQQVKSQTTEVQGLSKTAFEIRKAYWQRACSLLNTTQQQQAAALAQKATLGDLH